MNDWTGESELLRASLAGSREAFGEIVQRYQSLVCAITYSATGDFGKSEELAQETFVRAWRNLSRLEDTAKFRAWLCTIARNLARVSIRIRARDAVGRAKPLDGAEVVPATSPGPSQSAIDKEHQEMVWSAVQCIPSKYREPLVLFYRRQQSVSEVAVDLGLSEPVVRQRLHRGRQLVKAQIASLVEDILSRSGPGKAFAVAVVAALPAIATPTASAAVVGIAAKGTPAAKTVFAAGLGGAILGPILGLLGGVLGSWCSIRNTHSPRERQFMVRMTTLVWLLLLVLIGLPLTAALAGIIPKWACWPCFAVFFTLLLPLILWGNAQQRRIQIEDGTYRHPEHPSACITRRGLYASFGGGIFGGTFWLMILTWLAKDWILFGLILGCDVLLWFGAVALCTRDPQRYGSLAAMVVSVLMALTLVAVNLRWTAWMRAYRQSAVYDPASDVSLTTINLIVLGVFTGLFVLFAARYVSRRDRPATRSGRGRFSP
jgi:RNA polymerase sigma factor (sigma-70 family)